MAFTACFKCLTQSRLINVLHSRLFVLFCDFSCIVPGYPALFEVGYLAIYCFKIFHKRRESSAKRQSEDIIQYGISLIKFPGPNLVQHQMEPTLIKLQSNQDWTLSFTLVLTPGR